MNTTANEWEAEPAKTEFSSHGFQCRAIRHPELLHLCGYVEIPDRHPWHQQKYYDIDADVHGGLTFAGSLEGEKGWWIGFDCAHFQDLVPGMLQHAPTFSIGTSYRNIEYVENECDKLAKQAWEVYS